MLRKSTAILLTLIVVLAIANIFVFVQVRSAAQEPAARSVTAWERWQTLPPDERLEYVLLYQAIAQRTDAGSILLQARQFGRLPPQQQQFLRSLHHVLEETLDKQTPVRRRDLLRSSARARAFFIYESLVADDPQRLAELSRQLRALQSE